MTYTYVLFIAFPNVNLSQSTCMNEIHARAEVSVNNAYTPSAPGSHIMYVVRMPSFSLFHLCIDVAFLG